MDIIDVMLARAMTPQGQTETYVSIANAAAAKASQAEENAETAIATVNAAAEDIAEKQSAATQLLEDAQAALETAQAAQINTLDTEDVDAEIKKFNISYSRVTSNAATYYTNLHYQYPDGTGGVIPSIIDLYKRTGTSEVAGMTQKAITDALSTKADITYVNQKIAAIPSSGSGGGNTNLGSENAGRIVIVGSDGNIIAGTAIEEEILRVLLAGGGYTAKNAVGLEVDYDNKSFIRTQEAANLSIGSDFDKYPMYGGRTRCNVADDGTITAFYGDNNYVEDGSNGQVMVYQPKFYYQRIPIALQNTIVGQTIIQDSFIISHTAQSGFKLHPIFRTPLGEELDYVLFSAYEGGLYDVSENTYLTTTAASVDFANDKLTSVSGVKPITGSSGLSLQRAEQLANNRGTGWHIFNIAAESANQMLEIIEFGSMNSQASLGKGICAITSEGNYNRAALTGATASLGNTSGRATETIIEVNGTTTVETAENMSAINYRGVENPWGNVWQMLNGILIYGDTTTNGGVPYICTNYDYNYSQINGNYTSAGFCLPNSSSWISALGYGNKEYDWVLMPSACAANANSALPIGDNGWFDSNLSGLRMTVQGGGWSFEDADGLFYYGCDKQPNDSSYKSYGARLLYIPTKNTIYTNNIAAWQTKMNIGG